jgi:dual-specificity kinase
MSALNRPGLQQYTSARANHVATTAPIVNKPTSARTMMPSSITDAGEKPARNSGSKRDLEKAQATDVLNVVAGSDNSTTQPPTKKKVTYALPHQNMEEGHFYVVLGEDIDVSTQRFKILSLLGEGTFGKVVEAWDRKRKEYCAVKIVRNVPKYTRDARIEIQFMEKVRQADLADRFPLMKIQRYFENDSGHMCIVMPKYGPCLLDWLQKHGPFQHRYLAEVIFHSAVALDYFHSEMRLMHTDLKPENMLMENGTPVLDPNTGKNVPTLPCKIRLCDLGGCCDERHSSSAIVSTRHYRSPEVILGLGWMFSTDMWSMGCIIYELATGRLLYDTHDNLEHLHLMEKTLAKLPADWAKRSNDEARQTLYNSMGQLRPCTDAKHIARISRARPVREVIQDELLRDLIYGLLNYDRSKRLNARQMSCHPYVAKYYPESLQHPNHPNNRQGMSASPAV